MINWGDMDSKMAEMIFWARKYYNLPKLKVRLRLDNGLHRNRNWGGIRFHDGMNKGYISISTQSVHRRAHDYGIAHEYKRIANDPYIGSIKTNNEKVVFLVAYSHELAHVIHFFLWGIEKRMTDRKPHGKAWQEIYRQLRIRFVNNKA